MSNSIGTASFFKPKKTDGVWLHKKPRHKMEEIFSQSLNTSEKNIRPNNSGRLIESMTKANSIKKLSMASHGLRKEHLKPGDILLWRDGRDAPKLPLLDTMVHHFITAAQKKTVHSDGDRHLAHGLIWTKPQNDNDIADAAEADYQVSSHHTLRAGTYKVYRSKDNDNIGEWSAQIAAVWASEKSISYGYKGALNSLTKSVKPTPRSEARIQQYVDEAFNPFPKKLIKHGLFCTEYIVAAVQAAQTLINENKGVDPALNRLELNAKYTTPRELDDYLEKRPDQFENMGYLIISD